MSSRDGQKFQSFSLPRRFLLGDSDRYVLVNTSDPQRDQTGM